MIWVLLTIIGIGVIIQIVELLQGERESTPDADQPAPRIDGEAYGPEALDQALNIAQEEHKRRYGTK